MSDLVYRERHGSMRWVTAVAVVDVAFLGLLLVPADGSYVAVLADTWPLIFVFVLLTLPIGAVNLGRRSYSSVTVTTRTLRVGRHSWRLSQLDRTFLEAQRGLASTGVGDGGARSPHRAGAPALALSDPELQSPRVLGGVRGLLGESDELRVLRRDGSLWTMPTKNRTALLDALLTVVPE